MRMLVCDDFPGQASETREAIRRGWVAAGLAGEDLEIDIAAAIDPAENESNGCIDLKTELNNLFYNVRIKSEGVDSGYRKTAFDRRDIVLIDNNLSHLNFEGAVHTAETLSGYVRAFTTCGYIVSLNKNDYDFDLRDLVGDARTLADLSIKVSHLEIPGLWRRCATAANSFRPWYWPELVTAPIRRRAQIKKIRRSLDKSILKTLKFPVRVIDRLSRKALGGLSSDIGHEGKSAIDVTFQDFFVNATKSLPSREGIIQQDSDLVSRVVAAEIESWLRREVLAPQDVLVDTPHLVMRMPFLLGENNISLESWNQAVISMEKPFGMADVIFDDNIQVSGRIFRSTEWLDVPAFWWPAINSDDKLAEKFFQYTGELNPIFCEDVSSFFVAGSVEAQEFTSGVDGAWARRYVLALKNKKYAPRSMFAS